MESFGEHNRIIYCDDKKYSATHFDTDSTYPMNQLDNCADKMEYASMEDAFMKKYRAGNQCDDLIKMNNIMKSKFNASLKHHDRYVSTCKDVDIYASSQKLLPEKYTNDKGMLCPVWRGTCMYDANTAYMFERTKASEYRINI